jgi:putative transposase
MGMKRRRLPAIGAKSCRFAFFEHLCYKERMDEEPLAPNGRVIRIKFQRTARLTRQTDQSRRSMAILWNDMVRLHKRIRRARWKWPARKNFDKHFVRHKARYPSLPSACIQQAVRKFFGNLSTPRTNRKYGMNVRYPWRAQKRFATVPYRGNLVSWEKGRLTLGGGNGADPIVISMAEDPGIILKAELRFDEVFVTVARALPTAPSEPPPSVPATQDVETELAASVPTCSVPVTMAGDPGQRWAWTLLASNGQSLMVSGRGLVSEKIRRAKKLGHLQAELARKVKGSKRCRHLKRSIARLKAKSKRRVRDANHKISRAVVDFGAQVGVTQLVLSQPHSIAEAPGRKAQRQRNSVWDYGEQSRMIEYKAHDQFDVSRAKERDTSSTCPQCHKHVKPSGRIFRCPHCGFVGHRDLVGAGNQLGRHDPHADVAALIEKTHPKYLRAFRPPRPGVVSLKPTARPSDGNCLQKFPRKLLDESGPLETTLEGRHRLAGVGRPVAQPLVVRGKILELA